MPVQRALLTSAWREGGPQKLLETFGELKPGKGQVAYPLASACLQTLQWGGLIDSARLFFDAEIAGRYADDKIRPDLWQLMLSGPDAADALETFLPELEARPLATWLRADFVLAARSALAARKVFLGEAIARMGLYVWPGSPQLVNQLSRALFLQGAWSDAAAVIEAARTRYPGQDAYRQQLRALLLRQGDVAGAGALFDPNPRSAAATNSEILFRLEVARKLGNAQDMMRLGGMLIQPTYPEQVQRDAAATDATVLEGDLEEAKARAEMLFDSYPHRPALLKEVGRVHLLSGRFAQAHKMHARALRRERASSALAGYQPPRDIQDLLLPYARPTTAVESAFDAVHALSPTEQIEVLLKQPMPDPTNPVGWMLFLSRWMHSDFARFTDPLNGDAAAEAIPRTVIQFWEGPTLEPVRLCQESWQQHLTDHEFLTFDPVTARQWLADNAEPRLLQLYDGANGPAVRADIFRLAYLSREGGVYIDVDERLRQPMPPWLTGGAGLVVCHERWHGTLGNTFLAAAPNHPALLSVCAELMAQEELTGGIDTWLETGPGLITRTLGHWLFETFARNGDSGGLKIVPQRDYNGVVSSNLPFPHKFSEAHWRH